MVKNVSSFAETKEYNPQMVLEMDEKHRVEENLANPNYKVYVPSSISFSNKGYYRLSHNELTDHIF
ncbi:hypothetical protein [Domibacillus epiphyticus]|uniref:Uncharacterized protein n=1 Tax=Domibacillus epiphyticus TaxID=1714355 RepID=A0A1V2A5Y3_9BACI|nr:hypothetical protein [Domibacillus epiphyticus]OMP66403.1 hypothetical protein BTO28_11875 [Domibacillus epiphyticus]